MTNPCGKCLPSYSLLLGNWVTSKISLLFGFDAGFLDNMDKSYKQAPSLELNFSSSY